MDSKIVRIVLGSVSMQRLFLTALITFIFWNGLWGGAPRADQISYLHQISQYSNLWDILVNAPSWNRTHSAGDYMLFRPLLYLQLGLFYYLFGYDFFLWQFASLAIHIVVILGIHALLIRGSLKASIYPFLIAALFGCSFIGSELVLWNHISGYITFSVLVVYSILYLLYFKQSGKNRFGLVALFLGALAEFTYELGVAFNVLVAVSLLYIYLDRREGKNIREKVFFKFALLFLTVAVLYPLLSGIDLILRDIKAEFGNYGHTPVNALLAAWYAVKQIVVWFSEFVFPSAYDIHASGRAALSGFHFSGMEFMVNCAAVIGIAFMGVMRLRQGRFFHLKRGKDNFLLSLCAIVFLYGYSFVIAYGRAVPRGLGYVFGINTYYAYIASLVVVIALSFFCMAEHNEKVCHSFRERNVREMDNVQAGKPHSHILVTLVIILVALNSYHTQKLASSYRYEYSPARLEVIHAVEKWVDSVGASEHSYFRIGSTCLGNEDLPWFDGHFRKTSSWSRPVTLVDALWPQKSFQLNEKLLAGQEHHIFDVSCAVSSIGR